MPPTPITPAMAQLQAENERLKAELQKQKPKKWIPLARIIPSKYHDFEANLLYYLVKDGKLVTEEREVNGKTLNGLIFDHDNKEMRLSTVQLEDFVKYLKTGQGKTKSVLIEIEE